MKILLVGSDYEWSIERLYLREIKKLGYEVDLFASQNKFYNFYYRNIFNKVLYRLGLSSVLRSINKSLLKQIENGHYDWVIVFKGMEIYPNSLKKIKLLSCKLANFNPDNPFIFSSSGSGNRNVTRSISLFDVHFTYDKWVRDKIISGYSIPCKLMPFGFDQLVLTSLDNSIDHEIPVICFMGNPDQTRSNVIKRIVESGHCVHLYGTNWDKFVSHPLAICYDAVYGNAYFSTLRKYRVQLNIMRKHNLNTHNMRSVEIPGVGGIMLAPRTADHLTMFKENEEVFLYDQEDELINVARDILNMDLLEANRIRESAQKKVLTKFTYERIVYSLLDELNKLSN